MAFLFNKENHLDVDTNEKTAIISPTRQYQFRSTVDSNYTVQPFALRVLGSLQVQFLQCRILQREMMVVISCYSILSVYAILYLIIMSLRVIEHIVLTGHHNLTFRLSKGRSLLETQTCHSGFT
jgi:hypothetical protein